MNIEPQTMDISILAHTIHGKKLFQPFWKTEKHNIGLKVIWTIYINSLYLITSLNQNLSWLVQCETPTRVLVELFGSSIKHHPSISCKDTKNFVLRQVRRIMLVVQNSFISSIASFPHSIYSHIS